MGTLLWWIANAALAFVALPVVLVKSVRIIRSLAIVKAAALDIAGSSEAISSTVVPVMASVDRIARGCRELRYATTAPVAAGARTAR